MRADLNGSPGWQFGEYRWFVSSFEHGRVHDIAWGRKSRTKRRIACDEQAGNGEMWGDSAPIEQVIDHRCIKEGEIELVLGFDPGFVFFQTPMPMITHGFRQLLFIRALFEGGEGGFPA